jgi:xylitol oxidase
VTATEAAPAGTNWAGNLTYRATRLHRPTTLEQLRELAAATPRLRVIGSRHSFTDVADSAELVSLTGLPEDVAVDRAAGTVSFSGGLTYGRLATVLAAEGLALHNLASLPHISVAGAVATATHGSGLRNGNLATAVAGLELVTSSGDLVRLARGDDGFDGAVVHLGALGAVTRLTLDVEPAYDVAQQVFEHLPWPALLGSLDAVLGAGYSVSVFTTWGDDVDMVWVKSRVDAGPLPGELLGTRAAPAERHPVAGLDPAPTTAQRGVPGPWSDRLPHFRMGFTPSAGDELQSEWLLPRADAVPALEAVRALAGRVRPVLLTSEVRAVAADRLWLSTAFDRDSVALHFTWRPQPAEVGAVVRALEAALAPFGARPHWGKVFTASAAELAPLYPRLPDFAALVERLDPRGAFRNDWLERHVLGR